MNVISFVALVTIKISSGFIYLPSRQMYKKYALEGTKRTISLEKPLGILLEEISEGCIIAEVLDEGSASKRDDVEAGMFIVAVGDTDCSGKSLEDVMTTIAAASSPVEISMKTDYCLLTVVDGENKAFVTARQGSNLRKTLLEAGQKVYDFKGTLMNCNGAGQCGLCAVDIPDNAFGPRSDWEEKKLKNRPSSRLACQTVIPDNLDEVKIFLKPN
mmetsp:Transcript_11487/g.15693  ORF Transcript_11487/g.15693 Transcript_11487/m.15693 type:complete len:215 (+) Transcript_11487:129-773(+)